jgi:hypothetical protein
MKATSTSFRDICSMAATQSGSSWSSSESEQPFSDSVVSVALSTFIEKFCDKGDGFADECRCSRRSLARRLLNQFTTF